MRSIRQAADFAALTEITAHLCRGASRISGGKSAAEEARLAVQCRDALLEQLAREFVPPMDRRDLAVLAFRFCAPAEALADPAADGMPHSLGRRVTAAAEALAALADSLPEPAQPKIAEAFRCADALRAASRAEADSRLASALTRFADACASCAEAVAVAAVMEL